MSAANYYWDLPMLAVLPLPVTRSSELPVGLVTKKNVSAFQFSIFSAFQIWPSLLAPDYHGDIRKINIIPVKNIFKKTLSKFSESKDLTRSTYCNTLLGYLLS